MDISFDRLTNWLKFGAKAKPDYSAAVMIKADELSVQAEALLLETVQNLSKDPRFLKILEDSKAQSTPLLSPSELEPQSELNKRLRTFSRQAAAAEFLKATAGRELKSSKNHFNLDHIAIRAFSSTGHRHAVPDKTNQDAVIVCQAPDKHPEVKIAACLDGISEDVFSEFGAKWFGLKFCEHALRRVHSTTVSLLSAEFLGELYSDLLLEGYRCAEQLKIHPKFIDELLGTTLQGIIITPYETIRIRVGDGLERVEGAYRSTGNLLNVPPSIADCLSHEYFRNNTSPEEEIQKRKSVAKSSAFLESIIEKACRDCLVFKITGYWHSSTIPKHQDIGFATDGIFEIIKAKTEKRLDNLVPFPLGEALEKLQDSEVAQALELWNLSNFKVATVHKKGSEGIKPLGLVGPLCFKMAVGIEELTQMAVDDYKKARQASGAMIDPELVSYPPNSSQALNRLDQLFNSINGASPQADIEAMFHVMICFRSAALSTLHGKFPNIKWVANGIPVMDDLSMVQIKRLK